MEERRGNGKIALPPSFPIELFDKYEPYQISLELIVVSPPTSILSAFSTSLPSLRFSLRLRVSYLLNLRSLAIHLLSLK